MGSKNKNKRKTAANSGDNAGKEENKLIKDERFSKAHYDPRFQNVPKNKAKVKVDSRFNTIFTNKNFGATSSAAVDKRGKPKVRSENELLRYYHSEGDAEAAANKKRKLMMKKKKLEEEKDRESSELSSEESSESELEVEPTDATHTDTDADELFEDDDDASAEVEGVPVIEKETYRLAVVNMDWSQVRAVDLFVLLSSCLPKGGQIKSVAVYPSDFGIQRMEEEAVRGPVVALFEDEQEKDEGDSYEDETSDDDEDADEVSDNDEDRAEVSEDENVDDDDDDDDDGVSDNEDVDVDEKYVGIDSEDKGENEDAVDDDEEDANDDEIDNEKLRAYAKSRLRYYYAVVECDSVATAVYLYKACDGIEFERSSNVLDLRFIPDSMEFKHQPRDVATEAPAEYEGLDFQTRALQQSNTFLSWDDDEPHRVKTLRRNFSEKQLAEMESSEFFAESGSDEDETGDQDPSEKKKKAEILRALIPSGDGSEGDDEGQNMEVTFATGIDDASIPFGPMEANGRPTLNLERRLDHEGHPLAITVADAVTDGGVPPSFWRETPGNGDDTQSYGGRVITVKWGDYTRRIGVDGTADAIKDVIRSAFGLRTKRAFWLEDEDQVVRSLDRDMPLGTYTLHLDEGMMIKLCHYEESDHIPFPGQTISHTEEKTFYTEEDFRDFMNRRGWSCLRELSGYRNFDNLDDLRPDALYRGVN